MTASFTLDRVTFAAARRTILERGDGQFEPLVRAGLGRYHSDKQWYREVADAGLALWDAVRHEELPEGGPVVDAMRSEYADLLTATLAHTTEPHTPPTDPEVTRLVQWLSTFTVNSATMAAAAGDDGETTLEWVTMRDTTVRASHRAADGQVVPVGHTFDVDGHDLHHPGEPVGPPDVWINCRCVVRPGTREDFTVTETITAAPADVEVEEPLTREDADELAQFTEDEWDALEFEVPWHGVLAPTGVESGDKRKFLANVLDYRDFPFPATIQRTQQDAHDGAEVMARVENAWEEDGLIKGEGWFRADAPIADEAITLVANRDLRGFSVHLDMAEAEMQDENGDPFDFDAHVDDGVQPIAVVTKGRVASVTMVTVPAFQESYIALGTWADAAPTETSDESTKTDDALAASARCLPCEATLLMEHADAPRDHITALASAGDTFDGQSFTAPDGTTYAFSNGSLTVYAPGTRDGPGWITNPKDSQRLRTYWTRGKGAAKIRWGAPGDFNRCRRQLAKYVKPNFLAGTCANLHKEAIRIWPGQEGGKGSGQHALAAAAYTLVAAAAPADDLVFPRAWFEDPGLTEETPITVTPEGRVYGHIAAWESCHISASAPGTCLAPPHSVSGYHWFHQAGTVLTDDGAAVPVGVLSFGTGHAPLSAGVRAAAAHYDNTGTALAHVRAGEDAHGIWVAGVAKPGITPEERFTLRAAGQSGDWRTIGGNLELIASLGVNVRGFPRPPAAVAASAGVQTALVASGIVMPHTDPARVDVRAEVLAALAEDRAAQARAARADAARAALDAALAQRRAERRAALLASLDLPH